MTRHPLSGLAVLVSVVLTLSACSDDDGDPTQSASLGSTQDAATTDSTTDSTADLTAAAPDTVDPADVTFAESALLVLSDFPAGWTAVPQDEDDEARETRASIADCAGVDPALLEDDSVASAETPAFTNEDDEEVDEKVLVAASEQAAVERYDVVASSAYRDCAAAELAKLFESEGDMEISEPTLREASLGSYGDQTTSFRVEFSVTNEGFTAEVKLDYMIARLDRVLIQMTSTRISPIGSLTTDDFVDYVEKAVARVEENRQGG